MHQRDQQPLAAEQHALVGLAREQVLVRGGELAASVSAALAASSASPVSGCARARNAVLEYGHSVVRGVPVFLRELEAPRVAHRHAIGRRERVADRAAPRWGRACSISSSHGTTCAGRVSGGLVGRGRVGGRREGEGHDVGIFVMRVSDCRRCGAVRNALPLAVARGSRRPARSGPSSSSIGAWPTPGNSMSSRLGAALRHRLAVVARSRSDCAPRSSSVGHGSRPRSATGRRCAAAARNGTAMPGS